MSEHDERQEYYLKKEDVSEVASPRWTIEYWEKDKSHLFTIERQKFLKSPVADFGCGYGPLTVLTARLGFDVTGFDCIEKSLENGRKLMQPGDRVRFVKSFLNTIDAPDSSFASGMLKEVLEHIVAPEIPQVLSEIRRVLQPGALLVVTVPRESLLRPKDPLQHVTFFHSPKELALYLKKQGFSIVKKEFNKTYRRICVIARNDK